MKKLNELERSVPWEGVFQRVRWDDKIMKKRVEIEKGKNEIEMGKIGPCS